MTGTDTPTIESVRCIPVAGRDSMLLNLSGAHAPFFGRNLVIVGDSYRTHRHRRGARRRGDPSASSSRPGLLLGRTSALARSAICSRQSNARFADRDACGRGLQTFDLRTTATRSTGVEARPARPARPVSRRAGLGPARQRPAARAHPVLAYLFYVADRRAHRLAYRADADGDGPLAALRDEPALDTRAVVRLAEPRCAATASAISS